MTDRIAGFIVTLADDVKAEDVYLDPVLNALRMVKGVLSVEPVVADTAMHFATERRDRAWANAFYHLERASAMVDPQRIADALAALHQTP